MLSYCLLGWCQWADILQNTFTPLYTHSHWWHETDQASLKDFITWKTILVNLRTIASVYETDRILKWHLQKLELPPSTLIPVFPFKIWATSKFLIFTSFLKSAAIFFFLNTIHKSVYYSSCPPNHTGYWNWFEIVVNFTTGRIWYSWIFVPSHGQLISLNIWSNGMVCWISPMWHVQ